MIKYILLLCIIVSIRSFSQTGEDSISVLKSKLESFDYKGVITNANQFLINKNEMQRPVLIEIYRIKAIAQYSLQDIDGAGATFGNILAIDTSFTLDPANTSPKIISYYQYVKQNYIAGLQKQKQNNKLKTDTVFVSDNGSVNVLKQAVFRSILFPGLGHIYINQNLKGITLSALTAVSLGSMIYFIIDSNKKQDSYLNARDAGDIQSKYNEYNTSFKMRNISIFTLVAVWLYSQVDILFFSNTALPYISGKMLYPSGSFRLDFQFSL